MMKIHFSIAILAALLLSGICQGEGAVGDVANESVTYQGTVMNVTEADMPGSAETIMLNVTSVIEGRAPCSHEIEIIANRSTPPPWGSVEEGLNPGDAVEVKGRYIEDESGCSVTLQGSADYYVKRATSPSAVAEASEDSEIIS